LTTSEISKQLLTGLSKHFIHRWKGRHCCSSWARKSIEPQGFRHRQAWHHCSISRRLRTRPTFTTLWWSRWFSLNIKL